MPTRKDKTNVAPIYREQVFIPASGAILMKQQARPKVAGHPVSSGAVEIVSPEFDLLTGFRGITNLPKGFLKTNKLPKGENLYYRQLDKSSKGLERAKQVGVIDTKSAPPTAITLSSGKTIRIGKTFNTPFFAKGHLWYDKVDDMDVIVGKDNPLLDWKTITKGGGVTKPTPLNTRRTPFYMGESNQAPTELFELYRRYPGIGYRNVTNGFPTIPITGLNTAAEQMKCGGRRKAQLGLDIREGGIAIPIANNMFYIKGRKHSDGGVAIGPNNKNGIEVEGDEIVQLIDSNHPNVKRQFKAGGQQQTMRVFSSVPLLRGVSPAELVLGGANPDDVFKAQEEFKDRNRINDDGTRYEMGGEGKPKPTRSRPVTGVLPYGYTIRNLYAVENPYRKGIKGNVAKMYDSRTLGAGVDVVSGHPELYKKAKSGKITKKQADETAVIHLRKDDNAIRSNYADVYGKAAADTLSYGPRFLVAQARYQQGNVRKAWQPIHKAMAKGDAKALKKAVLQVTPKDHSYRRKWIEDFKIYKMGGDAKYYSTMERVAKENYRNWGFDNEDEALVHALNDNTYDYKGYYNKYPNSDANADSHWTDEFKTVYHPTFSIESIYSGNKSIYNPLGLKGGYWDGDNFVPAKWQKNKKEYGGMIYTINGNVKNGLSLRSKAQYGLATKYLKKRNKTTEKVANKQKDEPKVLDIRNTAGYKIKQAAENPWVKYPVEVASYLLTGATAKGMQTGTKIAKKAVNKIDDILGKPRQEYLSRNVSDKTIKVGTIENPIRPKDSSRITKVYKPTVNEISQAKQAAKPKTEPKIKSIDKIYKQVVGNKEPRSTVGNVPQWTEISYNPTNRTITAYDASVEFHKRISDILYDGLVKKYGKKGVDKAMKVEHISKYKYGGRIKAKAGKFLKYKNGVFTDPDSGEEYDVDPEVFKMRGNSFESGIIPVDENYTTSNYYYGSTFDNARPQFYAEKRLPLFGSQSIAEKAGLARSGWSYADGSYIINGLDYNIPSITEPKSSTPRKGSNKASDSTTKAAKTTTNNSRLYEDAPIGKVTPNRPNLYIEGLKNKAIDVTPINAALVKGIDMSNIDSSSTGGQPQSRLIGQYKSTNVGDWIGLGTNLIGSLASYFINKDLINKLPMPQKPVMAPAAKLKTSHNIEPQLTESREAELSDIAAVERNVASSNVAAVRRQRISNRARQERAGYYGQKENVKTQLINQDRLNRQTVIGRNVAAYNDWSNRVANMKLTQSSMRSSNINNLISGLAGGAGDMLSRIENRRATNNALRAYAAANPNVDARIIGGFDYYRDAQGRKYDKNGRLIG